MCAPVRACVLALLFGLSVSRPALSQPRSEAVVTPPVLKSAPSRDVPGDIELTTEVSVVVELVVEKNGTVSEAKVVEGVSAALDALALQRA
ncbi:MAG TPA: hypothetical protein PKD61_38940, partial [Polyangiaceae bacterium]|nr:hypothetical protein [Polyangiaceae bacterium]